IKEFTDEYIAAQKQWGADELPWHIEKPGKSRSGTELRYAVPLVDIDSNYFHGEKMKELVEQAGQFIEKGENFIVIKPDDLPAGAGWKTFLIALARKAEEKGYVILQTEETATTIGAADGNRNLSEIKFILEGGLDSEREEDSYMIKMWHNKNRLEGWVRRKNSEGMNHSKIIVIATEREYDGEFTDNGLDSKIRRMSLNGRGGLPRLHFPKQNWNEIIKERIASTELSLESLLLADTLNKRQSGIDFDTCQKEQEESVRRYLQLMANGLNARLIGVLQGGFGIGKSILLSRIRALLGALQQEGVVKQTQIEEKPTFREIGHYRYQIENTGMFFLDDEFGESYTSDATKLLDAAWYRTGMFGACNSPEDSIRANLTKGIIAPQGLRQTMSVHPFHHIEVVHLDGKDYMA
ncbi:hypothetical protein ACFL21_05195, partial [Patescibacteria group bacterium]